jgi:hypothetical protein
MMKALGIIVAVLTTISAIGICGVSVLSGTALDRFGSEFGQDTFGVGIFTGTIIGIIATIVPVILGGSLALFLYAAGEAVQLQISIEENTRSMAWFLQQQAQSPVQTSPPLSPQETVQDTSTPVSPPPNEPIYQFCPQCGTDLHEGDTSCPECNTVFSSE